jgi:hypothetical protein
MRRLTLTALLAVPFLLTGNTTPAHANPVESRGFGCGGYCLSLFRGIHQHGPLFNYGPYYGYYPFKPYGPWDAYLRYDPYFYGDPYRNWGAGQQQPEYPDTSNRYGRNPNFPYIRGHVSHLLHPLSWFHKHGCHGCGFLHASWLHGGWFRGHAWLHGGFFHKHKHGGCTSCGGVAVAPPLTPTGDAAARCSGFGDPKQAAVFYAQTPTLDPTLELIPTAGQTK